MPKPLIHPTWANAPAGITEGFSLEMIARDIDGLRAASSADSRRHTRGGDVPAG